MIYVGPGQANNETEILRNLYGSVRYSEFLSVSMKQISKKNCRKEMKTPFLDIIELGNIGQLGGSESSKYFPGRS